MNKLLASTAIAVVMMSTPVLAQSAFDGFYVAGLLGHSTINSESGDESMEGFGGVGAIGYGYAVGQFYGGIEAELGYDGSEWGVSASGPGASASLDINAGLTYGLSARLGAVIADKVLIYGRAGIVKTSFEADVSLTIAGVGSASASGDEDLTGFRFGGGIETLITDQIGLIGEYTYTRYGDEFYFEGQHLFRVGVAYHF